MKILAIGAHPDDIEIFMYGFLCACLDRGDKVFLGIATDGSAGGVNYNNQLSEIRKKETIKALRGIAYPTFFNSQDGKLSHDRDFINKVEEYIYSIKPDLILTHSKNDYHPDHRSLSKYISNIASFRFPLLFSETLMGINFEPDYFIDITKYSAKKEKAILCHQSQNPFRLLEIVKCMNQFRAMQCNLKKDFYVETFSFNKNFPYNNITNLLPDGLNSIPFKLV